MISENITFINQEIELAGTLYRPDGKNPCPAVVVVHSASGGERTDPFYDHLKSELPERGIAVLVFDRRGSGGSEGVFETADFEMLAGDVVSAAEYLRSRTDIDGSRIGLHGTSQGGWIAPIAAANMPQIACIVAVSASGVTPADQMDYGVAFHLRRDGYPESVIDRVLELRSLVNGYFRGQNTWEHTAGELGHYESEPWFEKTYLFTRRELPYDVTVEKWYQEMDYEPLTIWKKVTQPALFIFAGTDEWVPIEPSMENYRRATSHLNDVTFRRIDGTDHLMSVSKPQDGLEISGDYLAVLLEWLAARLVR